MPVVEGVAATLGTVPQRAALKVLRLYQLMFSPMFAGSCRFVPSCSAYVGEAIGRFGVIQGSWLALRRLARCRPLAPHGFDPVPTGPSPLETPPGSTRRMRGPSHDGHAGPLRRRSLSSPD